MVEDLLSWLRICFSISFLFFSQTILVYAQDRYDIQHYTNENGLPAHGIKGLELDKKAGFLWIGTQAGLVRFDGTHFANFSTGKNAAVSRTALISKNRQGTIYFENDNFSVYRISGAKPSFVMTDTVFYPFYQSKRWQALYKSANQLKARMKSHQKSSFLPYWIVFHDESGDSSSFSFVHFGYAYHYSAAQDSIFRFRGIKEVMKLGAEVYFADSALRLWRYDESSKTFEGVEVKGMPEWEGKNGEAPRFIWRPGMKEPLFLWDQNIWKLQGQGKVLNLIPLCYACSPPNADISFAQIWEEQGMIFLGSSVNGLYVVKKHFLHSIRTDTTTETGQEEYAQAEMTPGVITTGSGLSFSAQGKLLPDKSQAKFSSHTVYKDRHGDHWFHSGDTIIHFRAHERNYTKITVNDGAERMIFAEIGARMYVFSDIAIGEITGEQYKLLYKLPYDTSDLKNWLNPDAVVELEPGILAIASEKLILFDTKRRNAPVTIPIPDLTVKVVSLLKYRNYLLIGTYGQGFYIYKSGIVKKMPLDKNSYLSYTHCFVPDAKGFCWISTNHGIFKVSLKALINAYEYNLNEIYYHYFGKNDGIYNTEFNGGCQPCALKTSSGLYSFPSMNGVVVFDPQKEHSPPPSGQIFIEDVLADSAVYSPNDIALNNLAYGIKNLRFKLALSQFGNPENIYFSYKLEPYNDTWEAQDIVHNNTLLFGGLKPGRYKLYLRIRSGFETNQFKITTITFRILPPWYQTWWFYAACMAGLVTLVWNIIKWRTARIEKRKEELQHLVTEQTESIAVQSMQLEQQLTRLQTQQVKLEEDNKIKSRLISIISHDMISPLKFMSYLSKKMMDTIPVADGNRRTAEYIASVSHDMESLTANLLNWIRFHHESLKMEPERFNLYKLIKESSEIAVTLALEKGIRFIIDIPDNAEVIQYRQVIGVIIYNLSMNAVKYTATGEIHIACHLSDEYFSVSVRDTGPGMSAETIEKLNDLEFFEFNYATKDNKKYQFGYVIIKDLLRLSNGRMTVKGMPDEGTEVNIHFPMLSGEV